MTPFGLNEFTNIIVTHDQNKLIWLALAAHFDPMYSPDFQFIAAIDSALPCGILINLAETLNDVLSDKRRDYREKGKTLQVIFFDREEALKQWSPSDSIYGVRHLAETWGSSYLTHGNKPKHISQIITDQPASYFTSCLILRAD
ncbi:unnamed protein product [Rhizopus stolonifer]